MSSFEVHLLSQIFSKIFPVLATTLRVGQSRHYSQAANEDHANLLHCYVTEIVTGIADD